MTKYNLEDKTLKVRGCEKEHTWDTLLGDEVLGDRRWIGEPQKELLLLRTTIYQSALQGAGGCLSPG
jgi:hypothetical protein